MFNNAWLYNRKTSRVYKYCSKLAEVFESEIDPVMQGLGYCCGRKVRQERLCSFFFSNLILELLASIFFPCQSKELICSLANPLYFASFFVHDI